ncbi:hypothetical protein SELMODRAFT_182539 [Selaginella moellendorffii]|uniref:Uncharacterized protein n=1 Tax=Selaginella moellendorffii TaxID=88036 RepID=D8STK2_SELML|nr:autophagy-related protein 11 [Selaginella moellendorffii]EFJ12217.1 hypothetical protein SELMODRAFT_182539 [Selaginella moellendorffii]|eukprot:XP_002986654.1 autophagy-related protein 11 [Selaginella moellendorffii]
MLIHVAENGLSFELDCQPSTSVEDVQSYLVSLTGVLQHEQLLIVGDTRLEPHRSLGSYRLPSQDRAVFLFSRHKLSPDCPPPQAEFAERFSEALREPPCPPQPSSTAGNGHPLDDSRDPALRALPSYERQFKFHLDKGRGILSSSQKKFEACRTLHREQQVQEMALETARANMEHYYKMIDQLYQEFMKHFTRQHRQHSELLANFDKDLERLRLCKLHPALKSESRKTLMDCVKESSLKKWAEDCALSHKQFFAKVSQLKNEYVILQRSVEDLLVTGSTVDVRLLEETIDNHLHYKEEQASIIQSLSKDVNTVRKLIDDCVNSQHTASLRPHDAVSALGPMYEVHDKSHIPRMEACDRELWKLLDTCRRSKNAMSMGVHMRMQSVAALQASIRDMRNQLSAFKEAMARQDDIFEELKVVRKVGSAYKACLAEVVRRKACMKLYMGQAGQLAEKLARKREMEMARREEFLQVQSLYIPRDVLAAMGLFDAPSQCIVNIAPFDVGLLDIDMADLERYAPESLVGALYKVAEGAPDSTDDGELEEIAGTSKLEVENTWLKAELASAISTLCNLDPDFQPEESEGLSEQGKAGGDSRETIAARKTAEALQLKDLHAKQLHGMLDMRQQQCNAYEKRIRELEQRLREQDAQIEKLSSSGNGEGGGLKKEILDLSENSGLTNVRNLSSAEPMDEGSSRLARLGSSCTEASDQIDEGLDENMVVETETLKKLEVDKGEKKSDSASEKDKEIAALGIGLSEKTQMLSAVEEKFKDAVAKTAQLQEEVDCSAELLRECQMNCAHLENRLHEAREEARTNLCAAERRAAEYASLRASSVRLRGLMERLNNCISTPVDGAAGFVESLATLSNSLSSPSNGGSENREDPCLLEFQSSIRILADRVAGIIQQMMDRCSSLEAAQSHLNKDIESKAEMLKNLYAKHKLEKRARKEKICFTRFEVHELAVFMPNSAGHWEALNRNCPNYYLSDESIALFLENLPSGQQYIVGQIVHINRNVARRAPSPSTREPSAAPPGGGGGAASRPRYNPYGLGIGCEFFVVTVAMVPDLAPLS